MLYKKCSMNQTLCKTDFVAKRCKAIILHKQSNKRFLPIQRSSKCPTFVFNKNI